MNDENQIANILYRYAALIDMGRLAEATALFAHARIKVHRGDAKDDGTIDGRQLQALWRMTRSHYEEGTRRTSPPVHTTTNELDMKRRNATLQTITNVEKTICSLRSQILVKER